MSSCKVCGMELPEGSGIICDDCLEELRMKTPIRATNDVAMKCEETEKKFRERGLKAKVWYEEKEGVYKCSDETGLWESADGTKWDRVKDAPASVNDVTMETVTGMNLADLMSESPWGDLPPTQQKIHEIMGAMKDLLLYKNQMYGDSALNPEKIFYKGDSTSSILVRLNDKIGRVKANPDDKPRVNDVCDIIGYCTLLLISMGVTAEDIAKFKD